MSFVVWNVCIVVLLLIFVFGFRPVYKRIQYERSKMMRMQAKETDRMNQETEDTEPVIAGSPEEVLGNFSA